MLGLICKDFNVANIKFLEGVIMDYCEIKKREPPSAKLQKLYKTYQMEIKYLKI